ncbi:MAG: ROK family protein [Patescibacteria group bacterium]|jgi:glucokinase
MATYTLGLDVGGTKIQAGLVNQQNRIIASKKFIINNHNKKTVLTDILASSGGLFTSQVRGIGIGITGQVKNKSGIVVSSPNLPADWHNVPLKQILEKRFRVPVHLDNDANCVALAEAVVGEGKKYNTCLTITIGTGIGAGLVINKKIYHGAQGIIEFGHTTIATGSPVCSCGRYGHFEALVSGSAAVKIYKKITKQTKTPYQIEDEAAHNKKNALKVFQLMSCHLAIGLANAIHSYNPDIIILGGGMSKVGLLINTAINSVNDKIIYPELKKTKIVASKLKYQAGVIGAAIICSKQYR